MNHTHLARPETQGRLYEVCRCGAVRAQTATGYDAWHACELCSDPRADEWRDDGRESEAAE